MGDRANIVLDFGYSDPQADKLTYIFLYGHWEGTRIAEHLQAALMRRVRWEDPAYLARIIAQTMFDELPPIGDVTGFGLAPYPQDNEHNYLVVRLQARRVDEILVHYDIAAWDTPIRSWTYDEFIARGPMEFESEKRAEQSS